MDALDFARARLFEGYTLTEAIDLLLDPTEYAGPMNLTEYAGPECPECKIQLTAKNHMGYFTYKCPSCHKDVPGDLPDRPTDASARRD